MKFGKNIGRVVELSDPEWSPFWVNYKFLKKKTKVRVSAFLLCTIGRNCYPWLLLLCFSSCVCSLHHHRKIKKGGQKATLAVFSLVVTYDISVLVWLYVPSHACTQQVDRAGYTRNMYYSSTCMHIVAMPCNSQFNAPS